MDTCICMAESGLSQWPNDKESTCNAGATGDAGSIPKLGKIPGGGHGNTLQYSCWENPMDRGAWRAAIHGVAESGTTEVTEHTHGWIPLLSPQNYHSVANWLYSNIKEKVLKRREKFLFWEMRPCEWLNWAKSLLWSHSFTCLLTFWGAASGNSVRYLLPFLHYLAILYPLQFLFCPLH